MASHLDLSQCHIPGVLTGLHGVTCQGAWHSVTFQQYWLNWMVSHLRRHDTVTFQRYLLNRLNGITSQETWHCHIPAVLTESTEWYHISGDMTLSHSSGTYWIDWMVSHLRRHDTVTFQQYLLNRLNGVTSQETWHCHIPAVLTESTEWYHISGDMTLPHSGSTYWIDWMVSHLRRHDTVTFQRYLLTGLNGIASWRCDTLSHSTSPYWPDCMASHLRR